MSSTACLVDDEIPQNILQLLNNEISKNVKQIDFADITPNGYTLKIKDVANIIIKLFTWNNDFKFEKYTCPVTAIKVTMNGPFFDLPKLGYGSEIVVINQYPQLEEYDILTLGLLISINLCRHNSTLRNVDLQGNAIEESLFLKYILSAISFSFRKWLSAGELTNWCLLIGVY